MEYLTQKEVNEYNLDDI